MKKNFLCALALVLFMQGTSFAIEENYSPIELDTNQAKEDDDNTMHFFSQIKRNEIYTLDNYRESATGASVNIDKITRRDIERQNSPMLKDMLQQTGSVFVNTTNGSDGSVSTLRIRGTDRVKATLDGIRIDRPSMTTGTPEVQNVLADDLDFVEVIKGPQGNVNGTNASGGVVNMTTRRGDGRLKFELGSEMGNYGTFKERAAIMGGNEKADYYLSTTYYKTDGGMRAEGVGRLYNDGYRNLSVVSNLGMRLLNNKAEIRNVFRMANSRKNLGIGYGSEYPRYFYYNDPNDYSKNLDITDSLTFKHFVNDKYDYMVRLGILTNNYHYYGMPDELYDKYNWDTNAWSTSSLKSVRYNVMTQHNFNITDWNKLSIGYNFESEHISGLDKGYSVWTDGATYNKYSGTTFQNDGYINDSINIKDMLFLRGGARISSNNKYGTYVLPNASGALVLPTFKIKGAKTKFRGSWGKSVNNPTLYQRYAVMSAYGLHPNPDLNSEKLSGWDAGIEQSFFDEKLKMEFGYFSTRYKDYITYLDKTDYMVWPTVYNAYYANTDKAKTDGYEARVSFEPNDKFKAVFNYTYTNAKDLTHNSELPGVPKNMFNGMLYYTPVERLTLYTGIQTTSSMYSGSTKVKAKGGVDARLGASIRLFSIKDTHFYLKGSIYNLFNQKISMYRSNYGELYAPGIRFNAGIFIEYNPDKIVSRKKDKDENL